MVTIGSDEYTCLADVWETWVGTKTIDELLSEFPERSIRQAIEAYVIALPEDRIGAAVTRLQEEVPEISPSVARKLIQESLIVALTAYITRESKDEEVPERPLDILMNDLAMLVKTLNTNDDETSLLKRAFNVDTGEWVTLDEQLHPRGHMDA